jgi:hypothetical protein
MKAFLTQDSAETKISFSAFSAARKKYPLVNFLGEFWPVYLSLALIASYGLNEGFLSHWDLLPFVLLSPALNYGAYLLYVALQKNEILGRNS